MGEYPGESTGAAKNTNLNVERKRLLQAQANRAAAKLKAQTNISHPYPNRITGLAGNSEGVVSLRPNNRTCLQGVWNAVTGGMP